MSDRPLMRHVTDAEGRIWAAALLPPIPGYGDEQHHRPTPTSDSIRFAWGAQRLPVVRRPAGSFAAASEAELREMLEEALALQQRPQRT